MTDTDTTAKPAGKRARGGAAKAGGKAAKPMDSKAFLVMLTDAKKLVTEFQRALKQVSPKLSMRDYTTLARLNAAEAAPAEGTAGEGDAAAKKQPKARKSATASLQHAGLVDTTGEGRPRVTDQGRKVLADMDAMLAGVISAMGGKKGAATKAGGRNVPMALKAVKKSTRGGADKGEGGKGARRARRKAAAEAAAPAEAAGGGLPA